MNNVNDPMNTAKYVQLEEKIDKIYESVEKTRKYFFWTMIITIVLFVLPLIMLAFVIPSFLKNYVGGQNGIDTTLFQI